MSVAVPGNGEGRRTVTPRTSLAMWDKADIAEALFLAALLAVALIVMHGYA